MSRGISTVRGLKAVLGNFDRAVEKLTYEVSNNAVKAGKEILDNAQIKCPKVTKNLMNSGYVVWKTPRTVRDFYRGRFIPPPKRKNGVEIAKRLTQGRIEKIQEVKSMVASTKSYGVVIGFTVPYALFVHENPRSGNTGGVSPSGYKYPEGTYATEGEWKFLESAIKEYTGRLLFKLSRVTVKGTVIPNIEEAPFSIKTFIREKVFR